MTDAQAKKIETKVKKLFGVFIKLLDLEDWDIRFDFYKEGMASTKPNDDRWSSVFSVISYWEYKKAIISVNCLAIEDNVNDCDLFKAVIHELIHIILSPIPKSGATIETEHEEFVVTNLTNIISDIIILKKKYKCNNSKLKRR